MPSRDITLLNVRSHWFGLCESLTRSIQYLYGLSSSILTIPIMWLSFLGNGQPSFVLAPMAYNCKTDHAWYFFIAISSNGFRLTLVSEILFTSMPQC